METLIEPAIYNDTMLSLLLAVRHIPDRAIVTKVKGTVEYTLRHGLTVYSDTKGEKPMAISGYFLFNDRGDVNQISGDTPMMWLQTAEQLYDWLVSEQIGDDNYVEDK